MIEKVAEIKMTCSACPSQWEGKTESGKEIYIRLRHGYFRCYIDGKVIYESTPGKDGIMSDDDMMTELLGVLDFPKHLWQNEPEYYDRFKEQLAKGAEKLSHRWEWIDYLRDKYNGDLEV